MPSWNIHLEAGNRLADKLKFKGKARQEFLLGCLLPDINNGYINKVSTRKEHGETHYAYNQRSSLNFYAENKDEIDRKDPIFLGYLFHLYTDGFFNYDFYRTIKRHRLGEGLSHEEKQRIKHHDFWVYDTNFHHHLEYTPSDLGRLASYANQINVTDITPEDIENIEHILTDEAFGQNMKGEKYQFYTKKRLDDLMEDMIDSFSHDYLGEDYA
ncbi:hypothetical protein IKE98_01490 [Candidatus Saccharibacteria bacterium]|nr:hypothetical protein [Candidatus Saccharibacteria bacterium]